jgi:hypothetical protein
MYSLGDFITEQKLLEILNQLSNGGSAIQSYITQALTDQTLYTEFTTDRTRHVQIVNYNHHLLIILFLFLAMMVRLYHHEYSNAEHSTLPSTYFVESLVNHFDGNGVTSFDIELRTMLDEIMMWCVNARLPEELVRFLLSLLPDLNFKVDFRSNFYSIHVTYEYRYRSSSICHSV